MANEFPTGGVIGPNFTQVDSSAEFQVGLCVPGSNDSKWLYVYCGEDIAQYALAVVDTSGTAIECATNDASAVSLKVVIAQTSMASGSYGWMAMEGTQLKVKGAANCADHVRLFTTATAGVVDDALVSTQGAYIEGLVATASISNATAMDCIAKNMHLSMLSTT